MKIFNTPHSIKAALKNIRKISRILDITFLKLSGTERPSIRDFETKMECMEIALQPGDVIFFFGGNNSKRYDFLLQILSYYPVTHVGFIDNSIPKQFYHSTIHTYTYQRNGVHKILLRAEIERRSPHLLILVTRPKFKNKDFFKIYKKAKYLLKKEIKYSTSDALYSLLLLGAHLDNGKLNCGDFVNEVFSEHPEYIPIKNGGIPSKLLESNFFEPVYLASF